MVNETYLIMPIKTSKKNSSTKMMPDYLIRNKDLLIADMS